MEVEGQIRCAECLRDSQRGRRLYKMLRGIIWGGPSFCRAQYYDICSICGDVCTYFECPAGHGMQVCRRCGSGGGGDGREA